MVSLRQSKQITYKIHKAVFLLDKMSDQILQDQMKLGFSQFLVMMVLAGQPKVPQKFVAKSLDQTQAAVSRQIDILVDLGLVERGRNPNTRREYTLSLTKLGEKKYKQGLNKINERFHKLFNVWKAPEKTNLIRMLDKLVFEIHAKGVKKIIGDAGK